MPVSAMLSKSSFQVYSGFVLLAALLIGSLDSRLYAQQESTSLPSAVDRAVDFNSDVRPIFMDRCASCHGALKQTSDLRLDYRTAILQGSGSGEVVKVGDSKGSRLIEVVSGIDPDYQMPPEGDPLSKEQIGILRAWIDQGAKGPDDLSQWQKALPWSFQAVERPEVQSGPTAIDGFLLKRLQENGLEFSSPSNRLTLIRRLYLVALGVPPAADEIEQFRNDPDPRAYERLVDRMMASPRYGERMARHWLDVVRFAESNGFETNRVRYNAWPFRDYVIESFNSDKPYDLFVTEQIAGDAIGDETGTGFLVAGTYDLVKSPDINLTLMQRQDELADIVNTTGTTFIALTLGCARCHDHKFDPISQKDFYSLQAVFAGVQFGDRSLRRERTPTEEQELKMLEMHLSQIDSELKSLRDKAMSMASKSDLRVPVNAKINEESIDSIEASAVRFTIQATNAGEPCIDELEVYNQEGKNIALASLGTKPTASGTLQGYEIHKLEHLNDGMTGNERSWIANTSGSGWAQLDFSTPQRITKIVWGRDRNERFKDRIATAYTIEALNSSGKWSEIASSKNRKAFSPTDSSVEIQFLEAADQQKFKDLTAKKNEISARASELSKGLSAWLGTFAQPGETHRLYRGDPLQKREMVAPGSVASLDGFELAPDAPEQSRRVALAKWLTRPDHPLTARVMVNRLWHYTFGTGIVDTPSDFGINGTKPVHPQLLDWLADELIRSQWSLKHVHRLMLLSEAFKQSSEPDSKALAIDADARLLWRFPPRRLEAEAIRDSMLVASGVMDWRMGGPGFFLQKVEQDNVYRYFPKEEVGPAEYRRMVYLNRVRQEQDPVFGAFDCPSGNQVVPKRVRSNTPLQALNLFNSPFVMQQSDLLAERLKREAGGEPEGQVALAFQWMLGRLPDDYERDISMELIGKEGLAAFCRAMLNSSEFLFIF
jgi:hypothetical protein